MSKSTLLLKSMRISYALVNNQRRLEATTDQLELSKLLKQNKQLKNRLQAYQSKLNTIN